MKKTIFILIIILSLLIPISLFANNIQATTDIDFTFNNAVIFNETNPTHDLHFNVRNQTHFTDLFNATYSFTNEVDYTNGTSIDFVDYTDSVPTITYATINPVFESHSKVIKMIDNDGSTLNIENNLESVQSFGTYEFWIYTDNSTKYSNVFLCDGVITHSIFFYIVNDKFAYYDSSGHDITDACDNTWYHISIDFETTVGGYMGLSNDRWQIRINGKLFGEYQFRGAPTNMDYISFQTGSGNTGYSFYIDAIGFDWEPDYSIGDNLIPYHYKNQTQELDKWDFFNNEDGSLTQYWQQDIPYWDELLTLAYIEKEQYNFTDGTVVMILVDDTDHEGLERTIDVSSSEVIEVNFILGWDVRVGDEKSYTTFNIDSYDDTLICSLRIDDNAVKEDLRLSYYDGSSYVEIEDLQDEEGVLYLNITIISNVVLCETLDGQYAFPILSLNKDGIGDIKIETYLGGVVFPYEFALMIDSIGVYIDGVSVCNDFGNYLYATNQDYDHGKQYLFSLNATGHFGCSMISLTSQEIHNFFSYRNVSNYDYSLINTYNDHQSPEIENAYFTITTNTTFNINSIFIRGVFINDGSINYTAQITESNVNNNLSYYYVLGNRLYYNIVFNDNNTEYIQIEFNVPNIYTDNYTNSFSSFQYGSGYGYYGYEFVDSTNQAFTFSTSYLTKSYYLTNHKTIDKLRVLITDNDKFYSGSGYGYIDNIHFTYLSNVSFTLTTLSLLNVLIVIILMFVPALLISLRYQKKYLLPMLLLMTIVSYASALIPIWLMFIFIFGFIGIMFIQKDEVKE